VSIWHVGGLGAKFRFDPAVECLWYAYSHYLRMEDVVVAYVLLEQSRSLSGYIERVMRTLKANIFVRDGAMVDTDYYWVLAYTSRIQLMRQIALANPELGSGLCTTLFKLIEKTVHLELPCVKFDGLSCVPQRSGTSGRSVERCLVNKCWIANVTTPPEAAIIRVLHRLSCNDDGVRVFPDYVTEERRVFDRTVRRSFFNQKRSDEFHVNGKEAAVYPELVAFAPSVVEHAFCTLLERCGSDGIPLIQRPSDITVAIYRPKESPGVVPSLVHSDRYKTRTSVDVPLVVDPALWTDVSDGDNAVASFIKKALLVVGGYQGRCVSAGLGDASHGNLDTAASPKDDDADDDADPDDGLRLRHFLVEPRVCSVIVRNPHFNEALASGMIFGDAEDEEEDGDTDSTKSAAVADRTPSRRHLSDDVLFPRDAREIVFTEADRFEANVAMHARARVPLSVSTKAIFDTAYDTF
jgi:hypothetical protein